MLLYIFIFLLYSPIIHLFKLYVHENSSSWSQWAEFLILTWVTPLLNYPARTFDSRQHLVLTTFMFLSLIHTITWVKSSFFFFFPVWKQLPILNLTLLELISVIYHKSSGIDFIPCLYFSKFLSSNLLSFGIKPRTLTMLKATSQDFSSLLNPQEWTVQLPVKSKVLWAF